MSEAFLSYASQDRPRIVTLARTLEARGVDVWWDRSIPAGENYSQYIERRLSTARCVIVLWSKASIQSDWVQNEAADAKDRGVLLPVLIDAVQQPLEFRRVQAIDLIGWTGDTSAPGYVKLCQDMDRMLGSIRTTAPRPVVRVASVPAHRWRLVGLAGGVALATALLGYQEPVSQSFRRLACSVFRCDDRMVVGVMQITPQGDDVKSWWCDLTRDMLNATLNEFMSVSVVSKQEIDFVREKNGIAEIEAARQMGIDRMVSGTLYRSGQALILQLQVVEPGTGKITAAKQARGMEADLQRIQSEGAVAIVKALDVKIAASQMDALLNLEKSARTSEYKLMADTMGGFDEETAEPSSGTERAPRSDLWPFPRSAHAADAEEDAIRAVLQRYEKALQEEKVADIAGIWVELTDNTRAALGKYFANADNLQVNFKDITVHLSGDEALASFTRKDEFVDHETGREVRMELRVSTALERREGEWKIRGLKRPS